MKRGRPARYAYQEIKQIVFREHERLGLIETAVEIINQRMLVRVCRGWGCRRWPLGPLRVRLKVIEVIDRLLLGNLVKRV